MENSNVQVKKGYYATRKRRQMWFLIALCIVPLLNFAIFWVYVNFKTILLTFQQYDSSTSTYEPIGLTRYISVFKDYVLGRDPAKQRMYINALRAIVINL